MDVWTSLNRADSPGRMAKSLRLPRCGGDRFAIVGAPRFPATVPLGQRRDFAGLARDVLGAK
jgi:hypothetical protein